MTRFIYTGCDTEVYLEEVRANGAYLNAATVTWELLDGTTVLGSGSLAYTPGTDGYYTGVIPSTVTAALTLGRRYLLRVPVAQGGADGLPALDLIAARYPGLP